MSVAILLGGAMFSEAVEAQQAEVPIYIREYRVQGAHELPRIQVEEAVYPYLGPGRTSADVEAARAALEQAYRDKGFQAASVQIPPQPRSSVVVFQVQEGKVGKLRVKGSRYFSLDQIKKQAPSLQEGKVVNFTDVTRDIVALNQWSDRRVTPSLRAGEEPGTVDIDLNVQDTFPLHGSLELNNRYSANTTPLRLDGSVSYTNLWQLGHSIGASFQISPEDLSEVIVFSGYYIARLPNVDWLTLMVTGTKQESNVSTLGAVAVAGRGEVIGARAMISLPPRKNFYQTLSLGVDYKHFDQNSLSSLDAPTENLFPRSFVTYFPFSVDYGATWSDKAYTTELNVGVVFSFRGLGSDESEFDLNRYKADGSFIYLRGDLSHTHDLPGGAEIFGKVQGQIANGPLVSSEQFGGGGLGTVRGYLEAEALGDNAVFGTLELRSPSLLGWLPGEGHEWRVYAFIDGGIATLHEPLPEQEHHFQLASFGVGSRIQLFQYLNGSIDLAVPMTSLTDTRAYNPFLSFRIWAEF